MGYSSYIKYMALSLIVFFSACTPVKKDMKDKRQDDAKFNTLLKLNDLNERAFAYYGRCMASSGEISPKFLENMELTSNLLFDEGIKTYGWKPDYMVAQIVDRRRSIQGSLDRYYSEKGCASLEAAASYDHYMKFSRFDKNGIENIVMQNCRKISVKC